MTARGWTTIHVRSTADRAGVIRALFAQGAEGVQELDADVITSVRSDNVAATLAAIRAVDGGLAVEWSPTPEVDWSLAWRDRITAHRVGNLVVTPPWLAGDFPRDVRVVIDPGMAFGTGDHETTRGVMRLMQDVVRRGDVVADLGAGSAVLAIAAARLGAARAVAIELDPDAIGNAEDNIRRNEVADRVSVIEGDAGDLLPLIAPVRVVVANIISSVLIGLLPTIRASLSDSGAAILSGILLEERATLDDALRRGGWRVTASDAEGMWWSVAVQPE